MLIRDADTGLRTFVGTEVFPLLQWPPDCRLHCVGLNPACFRVKYPDPVSCMYFGQPSIVCEDFRFTIEAVQPSDLRRSQNHDAVNARAIPSFREKHGVAEDVVFSCFKVRKDLSPVFTLAVHFCRPEAPVVQDVPEFLTGRNQRKEYDRLPVRAVLCHLVGYLVKIRIERRPDFPDLVIAGGNADLGDVQLERNGKRLDPAEISLLDCLGDPVFIGQCVEECA